MNTQMKILTGICVLAVLAAGVMALIGGSRKAERPIGSEQAIYSQLCAIKRDTHRFVYNTERTGIWCAKTFLEHQDWGAVEVD